MKNILLVKGESQYGAMRNYIDEIASSLRKLGCNTCVLDGLSPGFPVRYQQMLSTFAFDAAVDCNGVLLEGYMESLPPNAIHVIYTCDHPRKLNQRLGQVDSRTIVFSCDNGFCDYMGRFYPMVGHKGFVPLSGSFYPKCVPYGERSIDILFTGSYEDPQKVKEQALGLFDGALAQFMAGMLKDIIANPQHTISDCLARVLEDYNLEIDGQEFNELVGEFMDADRYARFYYRDKLIRTLLGAGLEVHVFGNGWGQFHSEHKERLVVHPGGLYAAQKALADTKIALNVLPWFKDGFQERIASAMLSKAVAVTDSSKYINENFKDNKELLIYALTDMEEVAECIKYLLSHPKEAAEIAEQGYQKAQSHTWGCRVRQMLDKIEEEFGVPFIQEGQGRKLELEVRYPNLRSIVLDAINELSNMAAFAEQDLAKIEDLSQTDLKALTDKFEYFTQLAAWQMNGLDMDKFVWDCLQGCGGTVPDYVLRLFVMQCKALMSGLLAHENNFRFDTIKSQEEQIRKLQEELAAKTAEG